MRLKCISKKVIICCILSAVVINEYFVYCIQQWYWPAFPLLSRDSDLNIVMLFVSDPQILGYRDEPPFLEYITRWDADRYIKKSFELVWYYARPDVVIFLGDLFDEGSKSTRTEYEATFQRFSSIFPQIADLSKTIFVAGDNDVGGEGRDFRTTFKESRFEIHFQKLRGMKRISFVDFLKLDLAQDGQRDMDAIETANFLTNHTTQPFRILLNHEKVLRYDKLSIHEILHKIQPHLIFSAHGHKSRYFHCRQCLSEDIEPDQWLVTFKNLTVSGEFVEMRLQKTEDIHEIMTPTCSYRMGVDNMGYGLAILENTGRMRYTVLWQVDRYSILKSYLVWLSVITLITLMIPLRKCGRYCKMRHSRSLHSKSLSRI